MLRKLEKSGRGSAGARRVRTGHPDSWQRFFDLTAEIKIPRDFLTQREDTLPQKRNLFDSDDSPTEAD
jgi:hypothetical protein